jgi:hypothetical protein
MTLLSSVLFISSHVMLAEVNDIMNVDSNTRDSNAPSRLVEQAAVTFFRDFTQRGKYMALISYENKRNERTTKMNVTETSMRKTPLPFL